MVGGHAWWGEHVWQGACTVGGMHGGGMRGMAGACMAHTTPPLQIQVSERAVYILLECILLGR